MSSVNGDSYKDGHVYDGVFFSAHYPKDSLDRIKHDLQLDAHDIVLATYPRSGSTWMQEMISLICNGGNVEQRLENSLDYIFPELELVVHDGPSSIDIVQNRAPPRLIKTHLYAHFFTRELSKGLQSAKFIAATRNPKDALVSWYHYYRMMPHLKFSESFNYYFELFKQGKVFFGNPVDHQASWKKYRDHTNVMFLRYEDLKADTAGGIRQLAKFLDKPVTDEIVEKILDFTSFENMKKGGLKQCHPSWAHLADESISTFVRRGVVGDYKNLFTEEQEKYIDDLCKEKLGGIYQ